MTFKESLSLTLALLNVITKKIYNLPQGAQIVHLKRKIK